MRKLHNRVIQWFVYFCFPFQIHKLQNITQYHIRIYRFRSECCRWWSGDVHSLNYMINSLISNSNLVENVYLWDSLEALIQITLTCVIVSSAFLLDWFHWPRCWVLKPEFFWDGISLSLFFFLMFLSLLLLPIAFLTSKMCFYLFSFRSAPVIWLQVCGIWSPNGDRPDLTLGV